ncbi:MAG TPA: quinolinate synthase NadA [Planctomycetota bacterium]|nr:quinolinate synthase NadA [Planctomycetota bacterium]
MSVQPVSDPLPGSTMPSPTPRDGAGLDGFHDLGQLPLAKKYLNTPIDRVNEEIRKLKTHFGKRLVILGHHYQTDDIIQFADFRGDSFQLAREAARIPEAEFIVFCGVHFMAESADVLAQPNQTVILPDLNAGCSMADMASIGQVEAAWEVLHAQAPGRKIIPVTYMNSTAAIKAFCGRNGGIVCTSSNAAKVLDWAFIKQSADACFFFPDEHLGRNTAAKMGVPLDKMQVWDPHVRFGGIPAPAAAEAKMLLWKGHCSVHMRFLPEHVTAVRKAIPGVIVVVHPECRKEVVDLADEAGSTYYIQQRVERGNPGDKFAIGTEIHMVNRLAVSQAARGIDVRSLSPLQCLCSTMYRIDPPHLWWVLEELAQGHVVNRIKVDDRTKADARIALERMLAV